MADIKAEYLAFPIRQVIFHTVTTAAEHGEDGTYNLAVLIANQSAAKS
jgi:hypothetical protein